MNITLSADQEGIRTGKVEQRYVRLCVETKSSKGKHRPPLSVVFLVDTSRSMEGENLERVKAALAETLSRLRLDDEFGIITFSTKPVWIAELQEASLKGIQTAIAELEELEAGGYTELKNAWTQAYARILTAKNRIKRVIVISDGLIGANTDFEGLEECAKAGLKDVVTSTLTVNHVTEALPELLEASVEVGAERLYAELEFPEAVHAELMTDLFLVTSHPGTLSVRLGDLRARQSLELFFRLEIPAMEAGEELVIRVRLSSANSHSLATLSFKAQDAEPEVTCMDTLAGALLLEALELRARAKWLGKKERYGEARAELVAFAERVAKFPFDLRLMHVQLLVEQDALYYGRPQEERYNPENTVFPRLPKARMRHF